MRIPGERTESPEFELRKTADGAFGADSGVLEVPGEGVISGYAGWGLLPMWESGVGLWMVWIGQVSRQRVLCVASFALVLICRIRDGNPWLDVRIRQVKWLLLRADSPKEPTIWPE